MRKLEGEALLHGGIAYLVKGYQHPEGYVIAYPRYDVINHRRLEKHEQRRYMNNYYWSCMKLEVPVIPEHMVSEQDGVVVNRSVQLIVETLESLLEKDIYLTGSGRFLDVYNDLDLVIYGSDQELVEKIHDLHRRDVFSRSMSLLVKEHYLKHRDIPLEDYLAMKRNSILHFRFMNIHVNFKLIELEHGYSGCVDPVSKVTYYTGIIEIQEPLNPHQIPARYLARAGVNELMVESLREIYAELYPGKYYVENGRLEWRKTGVYIVPDHGAMRPISLTR